MTETKQPAMPVEPLLVRVEEAARMLLDSGELPSVRRGTARRIPVTALRAWVARQIPSGA